MRHLHNRLHGYGTVNGLDVTVTRGRVLVSPGVALDVCGREIVLTQPTALRRSRTGTVEDGCATSPSPGTRRSTARCRAGTAAPTSPRLEDAGWSRSGRTSTRSGACDRLSSTRRRRCTGRWSQGCAGVWAYSGLLERCSGPTLHGKGTTDGDRLRRPATARRR